MTPEEKNLKKLARTVLLTNFIKKNAGKWNHQQWEELCEKIAVKYSPIDFDQVGVVLEEKRAKYLAK